MVTGRTYDELRKLLGAEKLSASLQVLCTYSSDMYPRNQILKLGSSLPRVRPGVICFPEDLDDVQRVLEFCSRERIPAVPYGCGSGVCGAALPEEGCVIVDLKRMNRLLSVDSARGLVVVEPGMVGEHLEKRLNVRGLTLGHFPSSIACSTVGGYIACRSAGQYSSRYGKIEDMTVGLEMVLPGGKVLRLGSLGSASVLDPMIQLALGSEGTMGIVTKACLRVEPLPEMTDFRGFAFFDLEDGVRGMQRVMQSGVRPTVMRLYDSLDSLLAGVHTQSRSGEDMNFVVARLAGLKQRIASVFTDLNEAGMALLLFRPQLLNRVAEILPTRSLMIVGVQGDKTSVSRQWAEVRSILGSVRGDDLGPEPGQRWYERRYAVSYKQSLVFSARAFVDTMEVATTWDNLLPMYKSVVKAMGKQVFVMAHFSHAYGEGCSIYFTFAGFRPSVRSALSTYQTAWTRGLEAVVRHGGTISHHHSVGVLKREFMNQESPGSEELFRALKKAVDPVGIMNPGKLYNIDL